MTEVLRTPSDERDPTDDLDSATDSELIALVRAGDSAAYEQLFLRHRDVAIRYARRITDSARADDLCAEAFTKILDLLQRGKGPDVAFRAYLLTAVRTSHLNTLRAGSREDLVPDHEPIRGVRPVVEDPDARFDRDAICRAFTQLPERWQVVLWLTSVEGLSHDEVGDRLGIKSNAVASLAFRARAGLRQAYLSTHLLDARDPFCRSIVEQLPTYFRDRLTARRKRVLEAHLASCTGCAAAALELSEVDNRLGALLLPLALTGFSVSGATTTGVLAGLGSVGGVGGRLREWGTQALGQVGTRVAVVAGTAALGTAVATQVVLLGSGDDPVRATDPTPSSRASTPSVSPAPPGRLSTRAPARRTAPAAGSGEPATSRTPAASRSEQHAPSAPPPPSRPASSPTRPVTTPSAPSTGTPSSGPTATPTPTPPVTGSLALLTPTVQEYVDGPLPRSRVLLEVRGAVPGTTLVVDTDRTLQAAPAGTSGTGWTCEDPRTNWWNGEPLAATRTTCTYTGGGSGPLELDYAAVAQARLTATVTAPAGTPDASTTDKTVTVLLRS